MNTRLSDHNTISCPICQQARLRQASVLGSGLLFCSYCCERMVVSPSGSYVRDPFNGGNKAWAKSHRMLAPQCLRDEEGMQHGSLRFLGGVVIVALLWTGLSRLAAMSTILKPASTTQDQATLVMPAPAPTHSQPSKTSPSNSKWPTNPAL